MYVLNLDWSSEYFDFDTCFGWYCVCVWLMCAHRHDTINKTSFYFPLYANYQFVHKYFAFFLSPNFDLIENDVHTWKNTTSADDFYSIKSILIPKRNNIFVLPYAKLCDPGRSLFDSWPQNLCIWCLHCEMCRFWR